MYCEHFSLKQRPFTLTPDKDLYFIGSAQQEALNTLAIALQQGDGFVKISGEVGTGKTTLCRKLISMLGEQYYIVHINNSYLSPAELKLLLAQELGVALSHELPSYKVLLHVQKQLVQLTRQNKKVVLIIDEAQAMPRDTLEALRLISNLETSKRKLIQIILLGQPELDTLLARNDMRQLCQRIVYQSELKNMSREDVMSYLDSRVNMAGGDSELFSDAAKRKLYSYSRGNPRLLNILADKALMSTYAKAAKQVDVAAVKSAAADTQASLPSSHFDMPFWAKAALLAAVVLIPGGLGLWL